MSSLCCVGENGRRQGAAQRGANGMQSQAKTPRKHLLNQYQLCIRCSFSARGTNRSTVKQTDLSNGAETAFKCSASLGTMEVFIVAFGHVMKQREPRQVLQFTRAVIPRLIASSLCKTSLNLE